MSDETKPTPAGSTTTPAGYSDDILVVGATVADEEGVLAEGAVAIQGDHALVVARFADTTSARAIYENLLMAEIDGAVHIDGVLVVKADDDGRIHVEKMTDHSTRTGLKWGIVGGVVAAVFLPATIVAGAVALGVAGAAAGKARNLSHRLDVEEELKGVITPGTSGVMALVTAADVPAVTAKMPDAQEVKTVPVDEATAGAIKEAATRPRRPRPAAASGAPRPAVRPRSGRRRGFRGPSSPRHDAVHLDVEREAQERPDEDDEPERRGAFERLIDRDGQDDVGHDQDLEAEQDRPAEVVAQGRVGDLPVARRSPGRERRRRR